jgi:hypothetical protein
VQFGEKLRQIFARQGGKQPVQDCRRRRSLGHDGSRVEDGGSTDLSQPLTGHAGMSDAMFVAAYAGKHQRSKFAESREASEGKPMLRR